MKKIIMLCLVIITGSGIGVYYYKSSEQRTRQNIQSRSPIPAEEVFKIVLSIVQEYNNKPISADKAFEQLLANTQMYDCKKINEHASDAFEFLVSAHENRDDNEISADKAFTLFAAAKQVYEDKYVDAGAAFELLIAALHINDQNDSAFRELIVAIKNHDIDRVQRVIAKGVNLCAKDMDGGDITNGWSPLHFAVNEGIIEIVRLLIDHGARVNEESMPNREMFNNVKETPLMVAVCNGNMEMVKYLVEHGADVNYQNSLYLGHGHTASAGILMCAVRRANKPLISYLFEHGAKVSEEEGESLLIEAISSCYLETFSDFALLDLLLNHGANINASDNESGTPLMSAISQNNKDLITYLLKKGADINAQDMNGRTALMIAAHNSIQDPNREKLIPSLLAQGADANGIDAGGRNAVHYAVDNCNIEIAQILLNAGADVNQNADGGFGEIMSGSPLRGAVSRKDINGVKFLLGHGANPQLKDPVCEESALELIESMLVSCAHENEEEYKQIDEIKSLLMAYNTNEKNLTKIEQKNG
jgi:ankyrin repeat protein